ncbi:MAG: hypothetical protein FWG84_09100 [Bacteroidales bacterium]|nr:hypothetical protein [Bacteroidales bacterium]
MKKLLKIIDYIFATILIVGFGVMLTALVYTFIDLNKNSYLTTPSKDSIDFFLKSFDWCKSIIGSVFIMFSVFYAFQTFKIHYKNQLFNNNVVPREKNINDKLSRIKETNKMLHSFINRKGREIITMIVYDEENNHINDKRRLKHYFNKYLKDEIKDFEHSRNYGNKCCSDCVNCEHRGSPINNTGLSFDDFKLFAFELFCVSLAYPTNFETDIEEMYKGSLN